MTPIHRSLRAARSASSFLLDTEEFYHQADGSPRLRRWPFTADTWVNHHPMSTKSKSTERTKDRLFIRWKTRVREYDLVELADDKPTPIYYLELALLDKLLEQALARVVQVEHEFRKVTGKKPRRKRTVTTIQAARFLDVSRGRICIWIKTKGAPASKIPYRRNPGWQYVVNMAELEEWLIEKALTGEVRTGPAMPASEDIESALADGDRSVSTALRVLRERGFYIQASNLYVLVNKYQLNYHNTRSVIEPTDSELIVAMNRSDHRVMAAAKLLGLNDVTLHNIIERRGLRSRFRIRSNTFEITTEDLVKAMDKHSYNVMMTADHLEISDTCLRKVLRRHNLWDRYAKLRKRAKTMETTT